MYYRKPKPETMRKNRESYSEIFENEIKWVKDNLPFEDRYVTGDRVTKQGHPLDQHPSNKAHREFAKQVVSKWIE